MVIFGHAKQFLEDGNERYNEDKTLIDVILKTKNSEFPENVRETGKTATESDILI